MSDLGREPDFVLDSHLGLADLDVESGAVAMVAGEPWVKGFTWVKMSRTADRRKHQVDNGNGLASRKMESYSPWTAAKARAAQRRQKQEQEHMDQNSIVDSPLEDPDTFEDDLPDEETDELETDDIGDDEGDSAYEADEADVTDVQKVNDEDTLADDEWEQSAEASPESLETSEELQDEEADVEEDQPELSADEAEPTPVEEKKAKSTKSKGKAKGKAKAKPKAKTNAKTGPKKGTTGRTRPADARSRGLLEADILTVVDAFDNGEIELDEGHLLTPHRAATLLADRDGLDKPPSTGAVTNIFKRWDEIGFALTGDEPFHYRRRTAKGQKEGLEALKEKWMAKRKKERAAEREKAKK